MHTHKISGFTDLMVFHSDGSPIYFKDGLVSGYDLECKINTKYDFTFPESEQQINKAIKENMYMFDVIETNKFYYPNTNMHSFSNSESNINGLILKVKQKYI